MLNFGASKPRVKGGPGPPGPPLDPHLKEVPSTSGLHLKCSVEIMFMY